MKKIYLAALLLLCLSTSFAQNNTVSIHDSWIRYATATPLPTSSLVSHTSTFGAQSGFAHH